MITITEIPLEPQEQTYSLNGLTKTQISRILDGLLTIGDNQKKFGLTGLSVETLQLRSQIMAQYGNCK